MPIDRDRERAKRRYARRQKAEAAHAASRRRHQQILGAVIAVLVVAAGVFGITRLADDSSSQVEVTTTPSPTTGATSSATAPSSGASVAGCTTAPPPPSSPQTFSSPPPTSVAQGKVWHAVLATNCGDIELELFGDKAPQTVSSFVFLARKGFYDDTPCHRLTTGGSLQVLQCGDPTGTGTGGPGYHYGVENVPADGAYPAGTLAMARAQSTDSNGSQFFITYGDSTLPTDGGGYTVFGKVTKGLDILTNIAHGGTANGSSDGAPAQPISIETITVTPR
ncbi:MAG TPA: peptidylprolyl isomerase [Actinomycetales bacterium]|nr:peptidylprolyl isomerase [Actinomycetales bacterium]